MRGLKGKGNMATREPPALQKGAHMRSYGKFKTLYNTNGGHVPLPLGTEMLITHQRLSRYTLNMLLH